MPMTNELQDLYIYIVYMPMINELQDFFHVLELVIYYNASSFQVQQGFSGVLI